MAEYGDGLSGNTGGQITVCDSSVLTGLQSSDCPGTGGPRPKSMTTAETTASPLRPFVGREHERGVIHTAIEHLKATGGRRVLLVAGDPGIGKTSLLTEAAHHAGQAGTTVLYGQCNEDLRVPYQPFRECVSKFWACGPSEALKVLEADSTGLLRRLLLTAGSRAAMDMPHARSDAMTDRHLLFKAVVDVLAAGSRDRPILLALDDLQWADRSSSMLLEHILSARDRMNVALVLVYQPSELSNAHPLLDLLSALQDDPDTELLSIGGLQEVEVVDLVEAAAHDLGQGSRALAEALKRETQGNPFFVWELLQHLEESGWLYPRVEGDWLANVDLEGIGMPGGIREVIGYRVRTLDEHADKVLSFASVIGTQFDLELLTEVSHMAEGDLLVLLHEAVEAGLLVEMDNDRHRFAHSVLRHSLYQELSSTRRQRTHRRVAEALEGLCRNDPDARLLELAHHWYFGTGDDTDATRAIECSRRAGVRTLEELAPEEAMRWFSRALALWKKLPDGDQRVHTDLLVGLGTAQELAGLPAHRQTLLSAAHLAQALGDNTRLLEATLAHDHSWARSLGEMDSAVLGGYEAALAVCGDGATADRARLLSAVAGGLSTAEPLRKAAAADEALRMARNLDDPATALYVMCRVMLDDYAPETLARRLKDSEEAVKAAQMSGDSVSKLAAELVRGAAAIQAADRAGIDRLEEQCALLDGSVGQPGLQWRCVVNRVSLALLFGRCDEAGGLVDRALSIGNSARRADASALHLGQLFELRRMQGRLDEAIALVNGFESPAGQLSAMRIRLGIAYCETGRDDEATRLLGLEARADSFTDRHDPMWLKRATGWAEVSAHLRDVPSAQRLYDKLKPWHDHVVFDGATIGGSVAHQLGALAAVLGLLNEAESHFASAASTHASLGSPYLLARTQLQWAAMLLSRSGRRRAERRARLLADARSSATKQGFPALERQAASLSGGPARHHSVLWPKRSVSA